MAYSTNPNLVKARKAALIAVLADNVPVAVVARKHGVCRSTVYRWIAKWRVLNMYTKQECSARPSMRGRTKFCVPYYKWGIKTLSSRPHSHPKQLPKEVVERVLTIRAQCKRCAEVVHKYLRDEHIQISLSSVRRVLARFKDYLQEKRRRKYVRRTKRPLPTSPGALVESDTVYFVDISTGGRLYITTVIDLCTRMAYAKAYLKLTQVDSARTIIEASRYFGFSFKTVQTDNGMEYGRQYEGLLNDAGITLRHTRLRRPNDNAHVERFNRTLRDECIGSYMSHMSVDTANRLIGEFIDYYNERRVHLGLQCMVPREVLRRY